MSGRFPATEQAWRDVVEVPPGSTRVAQGIAYSWWGDDTPYVWHFCSRVHKWSVSGTKLHDVLSREPLTLSPSLFFTSCCNLHGFIIDGRWRASA